MIKNRKLFKTVTNCRWNELIRQLDYRANWDERVLIQFDCYFPSSKRCRPLGHVLDKLFSEIRQWDCLKWQFPNLGDFLSDNTNNGNLVFLKKYDYIRKK